MFRIGFIREGCQLQRGVVCPLGELPKRATFMRVYPSVHQSRPRKARVLVSAPISSRVYRSRARLPSNSTTSRTRSSGLYRQGPNSYRQNRGTDCLGLPPFLARPKLARPANHGRARRRAGSRSGDPRKESVIAPVVTPAAFHLQPVNTARSLAGLQVRGASTLALFSSAIATPP
jgi:hypothetical protein